MEQTNEVTVVWKDLFYIVLIALLFHVAAWCFWWGLEGRTQVASSVNHPVAIKHVSVPTDTPI